MAIDFATSFPAGAALPRSLTALVGRQREVAEVASLLGRDDVQLVTLTGPGGIGKTRLAIASADRISRDFRDGSWFIPLAQIARTSEVLPTIARALGIHERGTALPVEPLIHALSGRQMLLVLDNLEQVRTAATQLGDLLLSCPEVSILATSRIRLRLAGEWEYEVGPLGLSSPADAQGTAHDVHSAAVQLFSERARAAGATYALDDHVLPIVEQICQRLNGMPLAIELAAARIRFLPPDAMLGQLENSLPVLKGGGADRPARHKSMADAIRWSYDLLSPEEQWLFSALAVFRGGFTVRAAQEVCNASRTSSPQAVEAGIESLIEQSLLRSVDTSGLEPRFGMLEPVRDFAYDLMGLLRERDALREAHARFFMSTIDRPMPPFDSRAAEWIEAAMRDERNLLDAIDWAVTSGDAELAMRLGDALVYHLWSPLVRYREQRFWMHQLLDMSGPGLDSQRAAITSCLAWAEMMLGDDAAAEVLAEQTLALATSSGAATIAGWARVILGLVAMGRQGFPVAEAHFEDALEIANEHDDLMLQTSVRNRLCVLLTLRQEYSQAAAIIEESITITEAVGDRWGLVDAHDAHVFLLRRSGDIRAAAALSREFLRRSAGLRSDMYLAYALESVVGYAVALGQDEKAALLLGAAGRFERESGMAAPRMDEAEYQQDLQAIRKALSPEVYTAAWKSGEMLPVDQAVAVADQVLADWGDLGTKPDAPFGLTRREMQILGLLAVGRSNQDIADELFISVPTVKVHVRSILTKLEVSSRTAAAALAIRSGLA